MELFVHFASACF